MSAFLCDATTLAAIAREAAKLSEKIDAERVFNILLDENLKSVGFRYPDAQKISDWFEAGEAAFVWENVPEASHTATELAEMVSSYQYQSCEHDEWKESTACAITALVKLTLAPRVQAEKDAEAAKVAARRRALAELPSLYPKETAVEIRKILKANFPATKFSVVTDRGSMVSSVSISWTDGPTESLVKPLVSCFKAGRFDGMTDSYDYDRDHVLTIDGKAYTPACQYVSTSRSLSVALMNRCIDQIVSYWGGIEAKPVAVVVESKWGKSVVLQPEGIANRYIRHDVDIYWSSAIHQAASDRTRFTRND
jgi:hypothetical protein